MGRAWIAAAAAAWVCAVPLVAGAEPDRAAFEYGLGSQAAGRIQGTCEALALDATHAPARTLLLNGTRAVLHLYETEVNETEAARETGRPVSVERVVTQTAKAPIELALPLVVQWSSSGRALLVDRSSVLADGGGAFQARYDATRLREEPAMSNVPVLQFWDGRDGTPVWSFAGAADSRMVHVESPFVDVEGDFALFLEDAQIAAGPATGPAHESSEDVQPGIIRRHEVHRHAVLDMTGGIRVESTTTQLACRAATHTIDGEFVAYRASGHLERGDHTLRFDGREVQLEGHLHLIEAPQTAADGSRPVSVAGEGDFRAVGLDFARADWASLPGPQTQAALGVALVALLAGLWKLAAVLFTRLKPDSLLERDGRRRVYDAVEANSGISLAAVAVAASMSESNARYHLRVLQRHRRIRSYKVQGVWRFALVNVDGAQVRQRSLIEGDPLLRRLLQLLSAGPAPAGALIETLRNEAGLSRSGGWKVVDRAYAAQLVAKEKQGKRVILRSV